MRPKRILAFMCVAAAGAGLLSPAGVTAQTGIIQSGTGYIEPTFVEGEPVVSQPFRLQPGDYVMSLYPPIQSADVAWEERHMYELRNLQPTSPPTEVNMSPPRYRGDAALAPGDFTFYLNHEFTDAETHDSTGYVPEPSLALNGRTVWWVYNVHAAVSDDYGNNFTFVNTHDRFPPDGVTDLVHGAPFCCDQHAYYESTRGATFWLMLYHVNEDTCYNVQRIAVANGQGDLLNLSWHYYDFSPASFGLAIPGNWIDFCHITVSDNYLYHISKVATWNCGVGSGPSYGEVIGRYPLDAMAQGQGFTYNYVVTADFGARASHGATTTMYIGTHLSDSVFRIYKWPEGSPSPTLHNVPHGGFHWADTNDMIAPGPDGRDWARCDSYIMDGWVADGVIGFMWGAMQGPGFPYPHTQVLRVDEATMTLLSQDQVWHNDFAWLYPSAHPNDRGHVGGTIVYGGGPYYPGAAAWIADDYNGGSFAPLENMIFAVGNSGPATKRWGDYLTTRKNIPYGNTWGGSGFKLDGCPQDGCAELHYVWFGRGRDTPPAHHTIHVDWTNTTGHEDGSAAHPFDTVTEGHLACIPGDTLVVHAGYYPESVILSTEIYVRNEGGEVTIGP